jgi:hypothetical protein
VDNGLQEGDISLEAWREYRWLLEDGQERIVRIDSPEKVFWRHNSTIHRVVAKSGVVYCVPTIGRLGCYMLWEPLDKSTPVHF